jgi:hypothetical protein
MAPIIEPIDGNNALATVPAPTAPALNLKFAMMLDAMPQESLCSCAKHICACPNRVNRENQAMGASNFW